jgi:transcriptional regulator with XRE-family HTH domain
MSKRSQQKRVTVGARTLRFLRERAKLSIRHAANASGLKAGVVAHLEQGRIQIHPRHLDRLLPAYGSTQHAFEMFASGAVKLPQDLKNECVELVRSMSLDQLRTAHPVLLSLSIHKSEEST